MKLPFFLLFCLALSAQEKIFLDAKQQIVPDEANAKYYKTISNVDGKRKIEKIFYMSGALSRIATYQNYETKTLAGKMEQWAENGNLIMDAEYISGKKNGPCHYYHENGKMKRSENYEAGKVIDGKCFDENGVEIPYFPLEARPEYPGGMDALYRDLAKLFKIGKNKLTGKILIKFIIETDGSVIDVTVVQGLAPDLDKLAVDAVKKLKKWIPGQQNGKAIRVQYAIPFKVVPN